MNLDDPDPDKLIAAIGKVVALAGKTQQAAHNYKGYYYAWKENEPPAEAEAPETAPETKAAAVGSADEIQF